MPQPAVEMMTSTSSAARRSIRGRGIWDIGREATTRPAASRDRGTMRHAGGDRLPVVASSYPPASRRVARVALGLAFVVAGLIGAAQPPPSAAAAEPPPSPNRLDHHIVDLAVLDVTGADDAPRLLTVGAADGSAGTVRLTILQRDRTWLVADEHDVDLAVLGLTAPGTPWLVGLGPAAFALLTVGETGATAIVTFRTDTGDGANLIGETATSLVERPIGDAGAADIDGDGRAELVTASWPTTDAGASCHGSRIEAFDANLASRASFDLQESWIPSGVTGAFDGVPGDDLLGFAYSACPGPGEPMDFGLVAVRLADGRTIFERASRAGVSPALVGPPIRFDADGDGRDEALITDGSELIVLDPTRDWGRTTVATDRALALAASATGPVGARQTRIVWLEPDPAAGSIQSAVVARVFDRIELGPVDRVASTTAGFERWSLMAGSAIGAAAAGAPATTWVGDVDTPACPTLVVPLAMQACGDEGLRPGAAWVATRPVVAMGDGNRRRLLVAGGLAWGDAGGLPAAPTPWAIAPNGWWRHGPSVPFALSELRAADLTYYREFPVPRATIERVAAADRTTNLPGFTGSRLFVRTVALGAERRDPAPVASVSEALAGDPSPEARRSVARIEVAPGVEAGRDGSVATVSLGEAMLPDGAAVDRWAVTVVPINDWGEVGPPTDATIGRDLVGPSLSLEVPMVIPMWPLPARLTGASDPDTRVVVDGIGEMELDRRGRFDVVTQLAPWPQTLRLLAIDASGNVTAREVSVIGGVDYRRFPWLTIAAAGLLVLVAISGVLGSRRVRTGDLPGRTGPRSWAWPVTGIGPAAGGVEPDDGPRVEIEELPPGGGLPKR
jgi:hypothetical protein